MGRLNMDDSGLLAAQRMTPQQVRDHEFPAVMRGYARDMVDQYLAAVAEEMQAVITERNEFAGECERLSQARHTPAHGMAGSDPGEQAARILMAAQQQRENLLSQTQQWARQVGQDGERRRQDLISDGRDKGEQIARTLIEDATRHAADIIAKAPGDAQERMHRLQAAGDVLEAHLNGVLQGLNQALERWQQGRDTRLPENGEVPAATPA